MKTRSQNHFPLSNLLFISSGGPINQGSASESFKGTSLNQILILLRQVERPHPYHWHLITRHHLDRTAVPTATAACDHYRKQLLDPTRYPKKVDISGNTRVVDVYGSPALRTRFQAGRFNRTLAKKHMGYGNKAEKTWIISFFGLDFYCTSCNT